MTQHLRPALVLLALLSAITGLLYPVAVTVLAQAAFKDQAAGSLIAREGRLIGSRLIGQPFSNPRYFWSRPSATSERPYDGSLSGGSNLGPTNPSLRAQIQERVAALHAVDPANPAPVPVDLVTASASGLDPHISQAAAFYQAPRVARARGLALEVVNAQIRAATTGRAFGVFGEPAVNVLGLNLTLDALPPVGP